MPRVEVNEQACTGCGVCVETCPTDVLRLDPREKAFAAYSADCQGCFVCQWDCAYGAIRVMVNG
ncbi:MAG: ferredoxin family protein [Deltaproteobacteria bacterium]|nr:ferredoxin family protein [Deltaproteobacteria bacterium]